ncbi:MAG: hypothetical protein R2806_09750 [Saprospiraceae bacterium]
MTKKLLIITYYWPPSGGAGVQRWVKLSKYLPKYGIEPIVLTVDSGSASYQDLDPSLNDEVREDLRVIRTRSFEPINWYKRLFGGKDLPSGGFANVGRLTWKKKLMFALRSNLLIPDPRIGWKNYAYRSAQKLLRSESIAAILTTSPPHSVQLIGNKLKRKTDIPWIVDLRDPWTDIYYYDTLRHSAWSHLRNTRMERAVLENGDHFLTVSEDLKQLFCRKTSRPLSRFLTFYPMASTGRF